MFKLKKIIDLKCQLTLLALLIATLSFAQNPFALKSISGNRAPWGPTQFLHITANGQVTFYEGEANSPDIDTFTMVLNQQEMLAIRDTILATDFFSLNELYEEPDIADGTGVSMSIATPTQQNAVQVYNIGVEGVNRIARTLNALFEPNGFRIRYDKINED